MPYKSDAQRRYLHAKHPEIAARWDAEIRRKKKVSKAKPLMTDAELKRRKRVQAGVWRTTSSMGLTGLGITAASIASKKPANLARLQKGPGLKKVTHEGLKDAALYTSMTAGGIGGVGGFNSAKISSEEARRRMYQRQKVKKNWQPVARNYNPESSRQKRAESYPRIAAAVSGGAGVGAVARGLQGLDRITDAKAIRAQNAAKGKRKMYKPLRAEGLKNLKSAKKLGAVSAVAAGGAYALNRRKNHDSWASYAKSSTSAFGVDHYDLTSTTN